MSYYQETLKSYMNKRGEIQMEREADIIKLKHEKNMLMQDFTGLKYNNTQMSKEKG